MPVPQLPEELWLKICQHLDDSMRLEWWRSLEEYQQEYEEWPLCAKDHLEQIFP